MWGFCSVGAGCGITGTKLLEVAAGAAGTGGREYSLQSAVTVAHLNKKKLQMGQQLGVPAVVGCGLLESGG